MPTTTQINEFVAQPINNLIAFAVILALVIVLVVVVVAWKGAPALFKLFKQQADTNRLNVANNEKLTQIVEQNATQAKLAMQSVERNTGEMVRQTAAIEKQTGIIAIQGQHLRNYQTLVSDNLNAHTEQIEANTANIAALKSSIDSLPDQIRIAIEDVAARIGIEKLALDLRTEIDRLVKHQEAVRKTSEQKRVTESGGMDAHG